MCLDSRGIIAHSSEPNASGSAARAAPGKPAPARVRCSRLVRHLHMAQRYSTLRDDSQRFPPVVQQNDLIVAQSELCIGLTILIAELHLVNMGGKDLHDRADFTPLELVLRQVGQ